MKKSFLFALGVIALGGCYHVVERDGFKVYAEALHEADQSVKSQAAFSFSCPAEQLKTTVLGAAGIQLNSMGVEGCGKKAVYVRLDFKWVLNAHSAGESPATSR